MTRIAHVLTNFNPGTITEDTAALARDQRTRGWQVEFVTGSNATPGLVQDRETQGFPVNRIPSLIKYPNPLADLRALGEMVRLFRRKQFDLVHTHMAKVGIIARLAARLAGVKTIIHSVHGPSFPPTLPRKQQLFYRTMERWAGKVTDRFIFVSQALRDFYVQENICPTDKAAIIYCGKNLGPFMTAAALSEEERQGRRRATGFADPQTIILGMVARIVPLKGHYYAIQAFRELKKEYGNLKFIIVGGAKSPADRIFTEELISLVKAWRLENDVIFAGWQTDTAYYYSILDIYLMTSQFEGLSISLLEAYAAGLPVLGFAHPGAQEVLGNRAAKLVPPKDVAGLVEALKREIAQLAGKRPRRGENLAEIARLQERHSYERRVREIGEIYADLLGAEGNFKATPKS